MATEIVIKRMENDDEIKVKLKMKTDTGNYFCVRDATGLATTATLASCVARRPHHAIA